MLAPSKSLDLDTFTQYPVYVSPKYDGIRCLIVNGRAVSRTLKPIPNNYIRQSLEALHLPHGFDGELITYCDFDCTVMRPYNDIQSQVMRTEDEPTFLYHVFDWINDHHCGVRLQDLVYELMTTSHSWITYVDFVEQHECKCKADIEFWENYFLAKGFEGLMIKSPTAPYKQGRATYNEGIIYKLKRFTDSEALIIGMEELMHNDNQAEISSLGHTERSSCKANLKPTGMMGSLIVRDIKTGVEFKIGTGFTELERKLYWNQRDIRLKIIIKYKHQQHGAKDKPRCPVFLGFRHIDDL